MLLACMFTSANLQSIKVLERTCATAQTYTDVLVTTAKDLIDSDASLVVLDVRNQTEYDAGHIRSARLIPLHELTGRLSDLNKTDEMLVYCEAGGRSLQASQILVDNGFLQVYNMLGGFTAWNTVGYPYYMKYSSIQKAINTAVEGESLLVSSGFYSEHLVVNKSVNLVGEDKYQTILDGSGKGTILSVEADNVSISCFTIQFCGCSCLGYCGISAKPYHQNLIITDNNILSNGYGIRLNSTTKAILSHNNATHCDDAIVIYNSSSVLVSENSITFNSDGIDLVNSAGNDIFENTICDNLFGLHMSNSSNNSIISNHFDSNNMSAIHSLGHSANNSVLHNNFVSNAFDVSADSTNSWDNGYPSGGNYWSRYAGLDNYSGPNQDQPGSDGIGDTSYDIYANNTDHYPLMNPCPIVLEFPHFLIIPFFMTATLLAVIFCGRKPALPAEL